MHGRVIGIQPSYASLVVAQPQLGDIGYSPNDGYKTMIEAPYTKLVYTYTGDRDHEGRRVFALEKL